MKRAINRIDTYFIENFHPKIKDLKYFDSNQKVSYEKTKSGLIINVDQDKLDPIDTILVLNIK